MLNFSRLFILFIALFQFAIAQQVEFSQFYAAPLHLNNALAGISYGPRVAINYRNQSMVISICTEFKNFLSDL